MAVVRTLTAAEAGQAVDWAAAEGWNPGLQDLPCFLAQDAEPFLGAVRDGELLSAISATRYGDGFGFIGFYIARPDARGQGFGIAVWRAAMDRLARRVIGLDGVVAQQANYRRSGFALAWNNIRHGGKVAAPPPEDRAVVPAAEVAFGRIEALDRAVFPVARPAFLRAWLSAPGHVARALVRDGEAVGFGVIRPCGTGHKIGPLVARSRAEAEALLGSLLRAVPPGPVFLDLPAPNAEAAAMARGLGLAPVFETARMYAGPAPALDPARIFGITTFELG